MTGFINGTDHLVNFDLVAEDQAPTGRLHQSGGDNDLAADGEALDPSPPGRQKAPGFDFLMAQKAGTYDSTELTGDNRGNRVAPCHNL